jgi:hypothetical protein
LTVEALAPLEEKLSQTEKRIEDEIKKITTLKAEILMVIQFTNQNDRVIENLMKNIVPAN